MANRPYAAMRYENNVDLFVPEVAGKYDIPVIQPEEYEETTFVPFNNASKVRDKANTGIHFFIDDYLFMRLWYQRGNYERMFPAYKAVMTPDFSMYLDWPVSVNMWNHYRKHLLGAWMQSLGCKVYPSINWNDEASFEWCFEGEPKRSTVCLTSVGTQKSKMSKRLFLLGYEKMMEVLEPKTVVLYGNVPKECTGNIVNIEPFYNSIKQKEEKE